MRHVFSAWAGAGIAALGGVMVGVYASVIPTPGMLLGLGLIVVGVITSGVAASRAHTAGLQAPGSDDHGSFASMR